MHRFVGSVSSACRPVRSFGDCSQGGAAERALGAAPARAPGRGAVGVRPVPSRRKALALQAPGWPSRSQALKQLLP